MKVNDNSATINEIHIVFINIHEDIDHYNEEIVRKRTTIYKKCRYIGDFVMDFYKNRADIHDNRSETDEVRADKAHTTLGEVHRTAHVLR